MANEILNNNVNVTGSLSLKGTPISAVIVNTTSSKYFPITGGIVQGNMDIYGDVTMFNSDISVRNGDLTVYGNISATGNSYFAKKFNKRTCNH